MQLADTHMQPAVTHMQALFIVLPLTVLKQQGTMQKQS